MKLFKILIVASVLAFSSIASAVTVAPAPTPISIDFGTGVGTGGGVLWDGVNAAGDGIAINAVNIANATDANANGGYSANAILSFDTAQNYIQIVGTVGASGLGTSSVLFSGIIDNWSYDTGIISVFSSDGGGGISAELAAFTGESPLQAYTFADFSLDIGGEVRSTDLLITSGTRGLNEPPAVPVPAAAWLFGSGLLGLVGVARRKTV